MSNDNDTTGHEPQTDQPDPNAPLEKVTPQANEGDAIIVLNVREGGLSFGVRIAQAQPDTLNNAAHSFAEYLADALPFLAEQHNRLFLLRKNLHEATERTRIRLVAADGTALEG